MDGGQWELPIRGRHVKVRVMTFIPLVLLLLDLEK